MLQGVKFLFALLAVLVLIEAGAGVCQTAHSAGSDMRATAHAMHHPSPAHAPHGHDADAGQACHDAAGDDGHAPAPADHECDGGAACLDCTFLTSTLADAPRAPAAPAPGLARAFAPLTAPDLIFAFEPPPPRA